MSAYLKELTRPSDPFYLRLIKGSDVTMPEFMNRGVFYTGTSGFGGTVVSNATNPLFDVKDYIYTSGTTSNLDFWGYNYTIPTGMLGKDASFKFNFKTSTSNFVVAAYALCTSGNKLIYTSQPITIGTSLYEAVFNIPTDCTGLKVGWQFIGTASGETFEYDNVIFSQWTPQPVNLVKHEHVNYYGNSGTSVTAATDDIPFTTQAESSLSGIGYFTDDTIYVAKVNQQIVLKAKAIFTTQAVRRLAVYKNGLATNNVGATADSARIDSNISTTLKLNAGDYITIREDVVGGTLSNDVSHRLIITASAISENVVQSTQSQNENFTIEQGYSSMLDVSYGEVRFNLATASMRYNGVTTTSTAFKYFRIEDDVINTRTKFIANQDTIVTVTAAARLNGMGYSLIIFKNGSRAILPTSSSGTGYDVNQTANITLKTGDYITIFTSAAIVANSVYVQITALPLSTLTLIALPTSKINEFTANFDSVSSITQKSSDWIESISISDTSLVRINFKAGLFTVLPTVTLGVYDTTTLADPRATISHITTSYVEIRTGYSTATQEFVKSLRAFQITVVKNAPDYTAPGVFVGNVAKNQVATVLYKGTRTQLSTTPVLMPLVSIKGDSFFSISSNKITLQAGEYLVKWTAFMNGANTNGFSYLQNITDDQEIERSTVFESSTAYSQKDVSGASRFSIAGVKDFGVYVYASNTACYLGGSSSSPNDIQGFIEITKLNGN